MKFKIILFFVTFLLLRFSASGQAQTHSVNLSNIDILSSDISSEFFLDFQNISFQSKTVFRLLDLLDVDSSVHIVENAVEILPKDSNLVEALFLIQNDDWENARRYLLSINESGSFFPLVLFLKGWSDFREEHYYRAIAQFEELLKDYDGGGYGLEVSFLRGICYIRTGQFKMASDSFSNAHSFFKKESDLVKDLLDKLEDPEFALELLRGSKTINGSENLPDTVKRLFKRREFVVLRSILKNIDTLIEGLSKNTESVAISIINTIEDISDPISKIRTQLGDDMTYDHEELALSEYLFFLERVEKNKKKSRTELNQIAVGEINDLVEMAVDLKEEITRTVLSELETSHVKMVESDRSIEPWIDYFTTRSDYQNYLRDGRSDKLKEKVIQSHTQFMEKYPKWNYNLLEEIANRLVEIYSEDSGFSEQTEQLYKLLTSPLFSGNADTVHSLYTLAVGYFEKDSFVKAEQLLLKLEKDFPKSRYSQSVFFLLGEIYLKKEDVYSAYTYYEKASEYVNSYYSLVSLYRRGWIHDKLYASRKAIILYSKLLRHIFEFNNGNMEMPVPEEERAAKKIVGKLKEKVVKIIADSLYDDGGIEKLFAFIDSNEENPCLIDIVKSFGNIYSLQKDFSTLIEIYTRFLQTYPSRHGIVPLFSDLLGNLSAPGLENVAEELRIFFIRYYNNTKITLLDRSIFEDIAANSYIQSARYHNLLGRAAGSNGELDKAVTLYREYIEKFSHRKDVVEINMRLADLLYERGEYYIAGMEYFTIAWGYPSHEDLNLQESAALASVSSLIKYLEETETNQESALSLFYESANKFVIHYPDNPETINIFFAMGERLFQEKEYDRAQNIFERIITLTSDRKLIIKAKQRIGQSLFHLSRYLDSEKKFFELQNFILTSLLPDSTDRSRIVFKVGSANYSLKAYARFSRFLKEWRDGKWVNRLKEQLRDRISETEVPKGVFKKYGEKFSRLIVPFSSDSKALLFAKDMILLAKLKRVDNFLLESRQDEALELLMTCAVLADDSKAAYHYIYRSGMILVKKEQLVEAYKTLTFIEKNENIVSDSQYKYPVLMQLAYLSDKLKKQQDMIQSLKKVTTLKDIQKEKKMAATLKAGLAYESIGDFKEALFMFEKYISSTKKTENRYVEICFRAGNLFEQIKEKKKAIRFYKKAIKSFKEIKDKSTAYYAANAHFNLTEMIYEEYKKIDLRRNISKRLKAKKQTLKKLVASLNDVARYGVLKFTSASYYKLGMAYELLADSISKAPVSRKLSDEEKERYALLLAKRLEPIRTRAIKAYKKNLQLLKGKNYNDWIVLSLKGVTRLSDRYTFKMESSQGIPKILPVLSRGMSKGFWIGSGVSDFETALSGETN